MDSLQTAGNGGEARFECSHIHEWGVIESSDSDDLSAKFAQIEYGGKE